MQSRLAKAIPELWYSNSALAIALLPFAWLYAIVTAVRRYAYAKGLFSRPELPIPVIVVGNITVGGTGKTPIVAWLANSLKNSGHRPGIVSRGYGSAAGDTPHLVSPGADPRRYGDEAVLLAEATGCPVAVCRDRVAAVKLCVEQGVSVVISDDGLQHYRMRRQFELAVVDGQRHFGNGYLLPAGPLREPVSRLESTDAVLINGGSEVTEYAHFQLEMSAAVNLADGSSKALAEFAGQTVWAVAGIGNPSRFTTQLEAAGIQVDSVFVPDHGEVSLDNLLHEKAQPILMTSKDAVKYRGNASSECWFIPVTASFSNAQDESLLRKINGVLTKVGNEPRMNA